MGRSVAIPPVCGCFCSATSGGLSFLLSFNMGESHCWPLSDVRVFWMRGTHVPIKVVLSAIDMARHGLATAFHFALVTLALAVRPHVPCQVLLCGKGLVTA